MMFHFSPLILSITMALLSTVVFATENATFPAILVFGDSIVDPGNNNFVPTLVKANFPPYGRNFQGGNKPTGRFCNGKIPSDFAAELYGIKELVPPYLDKSLQIPELLTGVSFASGGAGYDPLTSKMGKVLTITDQVNLFKEYKEKIRGALGDEKINNFIATALFFVCIGSDDLANTYFSTLFRRPQYSVEAYADLLASSASQFYQDLYKLGARRVAVVGVPAIGCMPSQRLMGGGLRKECKSEANQAAQITNSKLVALVSSLKTKLPGFNIVFMDSYTPLMNIVQNAAKYGSATQSTKLHKIRNLPHILSGSLASTIGVWSPFSDAATRFRKTMGLVADFVQLVVLNCRLKNVTRQVAQHRQLDVVNCMFGMAWFEEVNKGCCGTGKLETSIMCNKLKDAFTCPNATKYVFWDSYHPTEEAYRILTQLITKEHPIQEFLGSQPTQPSGPNPTQPSGPNPTQPSGPNPTQPSGPNPTQPSGPNPTQPSGPNPTQPSGPQPTQPSGPNP